MEIILPIVRTVETELGSVALTHENAVLIRYSNPDENTVDYTDFKTNEMRSLHVMEYDFQKLLEEGFGWEYCPEENEESLLVVVKKTKESMEVSQASSRVRTFENAYYNHVETVKGNKVIALLVSNEMFKKMFILDYPWKYSPVVDVDSKTWRDDI